MVPGMMYGNGYGWLGAYGWVGMILNLVITVGVIVGVVFLVIWLVRRFSNSGEGSNSGYSQPGGQPAPREILQTRYARGEITREQYQQMLADLT